MQKLRLLSKSLEFRFSEFPSLREASENSDEMQSNGSDAAKGSTAKSPPRMPKPAAVTGTLTVKLLGAEGLLDAASIIGDRIGDMDSPSDRHTRSATYTGPSPHSQTLPGRSSHGGKDPSSPLSPGSSGGASTSTMGFVRRGSKHSKTGALANRHSGEVVEDLSLGNLTLGHGPYTLRIAVDIVLSLHTQNT